MIDYGMNVQEAGDAARFRHDGSSEPTGTAADGVGTVRVEQGISAEVRAALQARGHKVEIGKGGFGGYQGDSMGCGHAYLPRCIRDAKDGSAIGY